MDYLTIEVEGFFEAGALLKEFAGAILVGPEIGFGDLLLQFIELLLLRPGVKETSARPRLRDLQLREIVQSVLRSFVLLRVQRYRAMRQAQINNATVASTFT